MHVGESWVHVAVRDGVSTSSPQAVPARTRPRRSGLVRAVAAFGVNRGARLGAVAIVPLLLPTAGLLGAGPLFAALATYVLVTALLPRHRALQVADLLVAAALVLVTGTDVTPYIPFVMVAVAGPAVHEGFWAGVAAGGVMGTMLLVTLAFRGEPAAIGFAAGVATILLPPLAGVTAAAAAEVIDDRSMRDRRILQEANRLLSSLQAIAEEVPGGLDITTVAASLVADVRAVENVRAALVLFADGAGYRQAGRTGRVLDLPADLPGNEVVPRLVDGHRVQTPDELPEVLAPACRDVPQWASLPIGPRNRPTALLFVGFDDPGAARDARHVLVNIAEDAALALDNARLFEGTRSRAVDTARRQLASDLHDGVAQSLAHLRMELELLALRDEAGRAESERLARVAESALLDLRRIITGLRLAQEDGLPVRLERHVREVRTPHGPRVELTVLDTVPLDAAAVEEVFRVAQEAISNALRHAGATRIEVSVDRRDGDLVLRVEDDGLGVDPDAIRASSGVGFASMYERARRLQGSLHVSPRDDGGTAITLRIPATSLLPTTART